MKEEVKNLWVAALRSGKYRQHKQKLNTPDGYCCLGVLCDISGLGNWLDRVFDSVYVVDNDNHHQAVYPPQEVIDWAGMGSLDGSFRLNNEDYNYSDLANLNDRGMTFAEIANIIDVHWEKL